MSTTNKNLIIFLVIFLTLILIFVIVFLFSGEKDVSITTSPETVSFTLDGKEGKTPTTMKLKPGKYTIELKKDGYKPLKEDIKVPALKKDFKINLSLEKYVFKGTPSQNKEAIQKDYNDYYAKFPYANQLPAKTSTYNITRPSNAGRFNVYIYREYQEAGKRDALKWFTDHGVKDTSTLDINWVYDTIKK